MSVGPGRSVSINLSANAAPYIASVRAAALATGQLSAQLRAAAAASTTLTGASTGTATASRAAVAASAAQTAALRTQATSANATATATGRLRNAQGQFVSASSATVAASQAQTAALRAQAGASTAATAASGQLRNAQGQFIAGSGAATAASTASAAAATRHAAAQKLVGSALLGVGGALGLLAGAAAVTFARFDQQMSQLRSVSGATQTEMKALSAAALKAGADTVFSASEAAQAQTELAKAGVSTADILGGALTGSLSLASAGGLKLARAAEVAGQTMNVFGLEARDVERIADTLANGANKSAADVEQLSQSLSEAGLVANQTGLTMEDTVGVLAAFADNALVGSNAGTSLKSMLQRLTPQSQEAAKEMERLGITAYDAQGNFVGITEYAGILQNGLKNLTAEQRNTSLGIIFGSDAVKAATVLYGEGSQGIAEYVAAVSESGAAARVSAIQLDNLAGDFEELKGSLETGLIQSGAAFNDILRDMVQAITGVVNAYNSLDPGTQGAIATFVALAAIVALLGGAALTIIPKIAAMQAALTSLGVTAAGTSAALSAMAAVLAVVGAAWAVNEIVKFSQQVDITEGSTRRLAQALGDLDNLNGGAFDELIRGSLAGEDAMERFGTAAARALSQDWDSQANRFTDFGASVGEFDQYVMALDASIAQMVQSGNIQGAADAYDRLIASIEAQNAAGENINVDDVAAKFTQYQGALDAANSAQQTATGSAEELYAGLTAGGEAAETARAAIDDMVQSLAAAGLVQLSTRDAARQWEQALDDVTAAIAENGTTLDINTQAGRDNQAALDDVAKAAIGQAQAIYDSTQSEEQFRQSLIQSRAGLVASAMQFGLTEAEAGAFADTVLNIPAVKTVNFSTPGLAEAVQNADILRSSLAKIGDKTITVQTRYVTSGTPTTNTQRVGTATGSAAGGYIRGPGTTTSDSILALLSDKEYVIRAAAVDRYGVGFFDRVNSMRFASGGLVDKSMAAARVSASTTAGSRSFNFDVKTERTWTPAEALQLLVRAESMYGL